MTSLLSCDAIWCRRESWRGAGAPSVVRGVSASFRRGELCGFVGGDGCGKGLLLNVLGMLEAPDSGRVEIDSGGMPGPVVREQTFGYLFSQTGLLPGFSVCENVAVPLFRIRGVPSGQAGEITRHAMDLCGCGELASTPAGELDPPSRARVALARALVHDPAIMIVISPRAEVEILPLAERLARDRNLCILWAGDTENLARHAHRLITMQEGEISSDTGP